MLAYQHPRSIFHLGSGHFISPRLSSICENTAIHHLTLMNLHRPSFWRASARLFQNSHWRRVRHAIFEAAASPNGVMRMHIRQDIFPHYSAAAIVSCWFCMCGVERHSNSRQCTFRTASEGLLPSSEVYRLPPIDGGRIDTSAPHHIRTA
jgi:hypothetical protein